MMAICCYEGLVGRYALQETDGALSRIWLGDRIEKVPKEFEVEETPLLAEAHRQLAAYFDRRLKSFDIPLLLAGTPFQLKIWHLLQEIPYGALVTYGELACKSGNAKACRAVGMANSRNPLPIIVPCHRVVAAGGKLGGYTGGLDIKRALLRLEGL